MKIKKDLLAIIILTLSALFLGSCTSRVGAASSWPGLSLSDETAYISYAAQTYAVNLENGSLLWKFPAESDNGRQAYSPPQFSDGSVVFGDYGGELVAVDAENGTEKWTFSGAGDRYIAAVDFSQDSVYAPNSDGTVYALDMDGNLIWKFSTDGPNWTKPVSNEEFIYIASMDHYLYAIDRNVSAASLVIAKDGSRTLLEEAVWTTDLGMAVVADPVLMDGVIYVATIEGVLSAVDADSGSILWTFDDGGKLGAVWGAPVIMDPIVFVGDMNGNVYAIDRENGKAYWPSPFSAGGKIVSAGAITEEGVVFANDEGKLFLINREKEPKTLYSFENAINSSILVDGDNIIVAPASEEGLLAAFNLEGFEVWSFLPNE